MEPKTRLYFHKSITYCTVSGKKGMPYIYTIIDSHSDYIYLRRKIRKRIFGHVRPAKIQNNLHIRAV